MNRKFLSGLVAGGMQHVRYAATPQTSNFAIRQLAKQGFYNASKQQQLEILQKMVTQAKAGAGQASKAFQQVGAKIGGAGKQITSQAFKGSRLRGLEQQALKEPIAKEAQRQAARAATRKQMQRAIAKRAVGKSAITKAAPAAAKAAGIGTGVGLAAIGGAAVLGAAAIGRTWWKHRQEVGQNVRETSERQADLIRAIREQRARKRR